jgi:hypothetical protein
MAATPYPAYKTATTRITSPGIDCRMAAAPYPAYKSEPTATLTLFLSAI